MDASKLGGLKGKEKAVDEIGGNLGGGVGERLTFDGGIGERSDFDGGMGEKLNFECGTAERLNFDSGKGKRLDFDGVVAERLDFDGGVGGRMNFDGGFGDRLNFDGGIHENLNFDSSNMCDLSGRKRGLDEIGGDLDVGVSGKRRVEVFDRIDGESRAGKEVVEEGNAVVNLLMGDSTRGGIGRAEFVGSSVAVGVSDKECVEVVNISSDDEEEELVVVQDNKGKGKIIENEAIIGINLGLDLGYDYEKINEVDQAASGSNEKGKAIDVQPSLPPGGESTDYGFLYALEHMMDPVPEFDLELPEIFQQNEVVGNLDHLNWQQIIDHLQREERLRDHLQREERLRDLQLRIEQNEREIERRKEEIERRKEELARIDEDRRQREIEDRKRVHRRFARPLEEDGYRGSSENEQNLLLTTGNMNRDKKQRRRDQPLIRWKPSESRENNVVKRFVPSLLDLSLNVLANNADMIVSLEGVPYILKQRLSNLLCDSRKMNSRVLDLFIRDSPEEIRIKDASWITEDQFRRSFGSFSPNKLKVFQFDLGGQCVSDDIIAETLAHSLSSLPGLGIISLRGACHLSDEALKVLVKLAPALCSINLGECSRLTHVGINYIADALGNSLRELLIDNCSRVDARDMASAVAKFQYLEVLSVAGIPNLCDRVISDIITACGRTIKYLDLADCERLTDSSFKIIGQNCSDLRALNIINLHNLTDVGLSDLANGCKSIQSLKLGRNKFSDEAIADFIEIAGRSLEELSLNHVRQVGPFTALSLAKFSRKLSSLDLSWCRKITDEALGLIVDSCWSLKLLKLFGCTQITNVFLDGHSNSLVKIVGLNMTSLLEGAGMLKAEEVYLRYSPLPIPCRSENYLDHEDV